MDDLALVLDSLLLLEPERAHEPVRGAGHVLVAEHRRDLRELADAPMMTRNRVGLPARPTIARCERPFPSTPTAGASRPRSMRSRSTWVGRACGCAAGSRPSPTLTSRTARSSSTWRWAASVASSAASGGFGTRTRFEWFYVRPHQSATRTRRSTRRSSTAAASWQLYHGEPVLRSPCSCPSTSGSACGSASRVTAASIDVAASRSRPCP